MSDAVLKLGDHQVNLVAGSGGVFEVTADGRTYSPKQTATAFLSRGDSGPSGGRITHSERSATSRAKYIQQGPQLHQAYRDNRRIWVR